MSQTNPDLQAIPADYSVRKQFLPRKGQVLLHPESQKAREEFANYFCKFDFTGQVPQEKEKNA